MKGQKQRLTPERPLDVIKKLEKNGLKNVSRHGGEWFYHRIKDGRECLVCVSVHPREIDVQLLRNIIRKAGKDRKEWLNL